MANNKGKSTIIILVALFLISLALASSGFYFLQNERKKSTTLSEELDEVKTRQRVNEAKLEESKTMIAALENKYKDSQAQIDSLTNELQQEKGAKSQAQAQMEQMRADLEQQKKLRADFEKKVNQSQVDMKKVQSQLKELEVKKNELEQKVNDLEIKSEEQAQSGVELGTIVVTPEAGPRVVSGQKTTKTSASQTSKKASVSSEAVKVVVPVNEGKVLVVNKDYNFVVLSLGSKDGVTIGSVFSVYHNNKLSGEVKVEKVHESMAAAGFLSPGSKDKIIEGDKVVLKSR